MGELGIARRRLLFTNWSEEIADPFVQKLISSLQGQPSEDGYSPVVEFVISSILLEPQLVESDSSGELWALLPPLFENLTDAEGKKALTRAAILFAVRSQDTEISGQSRDFVLTVWRNLSDPFLREDLEFVRSTGAPQSQELLKDGVEQELGSIREEMQRPTDRTAQRVTLCLDYGDSLQGRPLDDAMIESLDAKRASALETWLGIIDRNENRFGQGFPDRFALRCLDIVPAISEDSERQKLLLQAFVGRFEGLSPEEKRSALRKYFALMKDPQLGTRRAAASMLKGVREASFDTQDFKLALANVIKYLRDEVRTGELLQYDDVFDGLLTQGGALAEYQNRDLANIAKALMSRTEGPLQELGLRVVEQMPSIPNDDQAEVIHLLIGISSSSPSLKQRASDRLSQFSLEEVVDGARQELEDWRKPES